MDFRILILSLASLLFWACASKEYFKPLQVAGKKSFTGDLSSKMIDTSKTGATLKEGKVITKDGTEFPLPKDEVFVSYTQKHLITSKHCNTLIVYTPQKELKAQIETPSCPVSVAMDDGRLAVVGNDNTLLLYEISSQKEIFQKKNNPALAVNSLLQEPVFWKNSVFFPTLDGSVSVVNLKTLELEKSLIVDSAPFFNNVIFLSVQKDQILAATAKRLMSVYGGKTYNYEEEVRDIKIHEGRIYLSTLDGQIKELDFTLNVLRSLKFQFASLPLFGIAKNKLYAIEDGSGFLIEIDLDSFTPLVYELKVSRGENAFVDRHRLYYKNHYLEF